MPTKTINTILNLKDKFSSKIKQATEKTKQNSKQMKLLNNHVQAFRQSAVSSFTVVAKKAAAVGTAFVGVGAAAAAMGNSVDFVKDYKTSLSNLQAATGATAEEMAVMKKQITDLYKKNLGESWSDLSSAMTLVKQVTGQTGNELKQTTALAVTYRDVFGEDIAESIKAADTMMKNFGISSTQAFNLLAQGAQRGLNKSGELLDTANEYGVYFRNLGFSANEMFDMFSAGLEKGAFNLDKVGDSVKEFQIRIKDDSKTTKEALSELGLNADKMMRTFAKGGDGAKQAFKQVVDAISAVKDPVKKNVIGVQLFGTQFEDMEKDVIAALGTARSQFDMTKNTMNEINKIKYDSTSQAFKGIGRMVETSVLMPIANRLLPKLNDFGQWFKDHTPQIEGAIDKAFTAGGKVIDGFRQSIAWAKDNANWLIPVIGGLTSAIAAQKIISTITKLYKTWTTVTKGMTLAQIALNIATKATPFGWIATLIGLVIGAGVALWQNWDVVKQKASELWNWLTGIWENIKSATVNVFSGMGDTIKNSFEAVVGFVKKPINAVIDTINWLIDKINNISFEIPDWVPEWAGGGKTFGINIPKIPNFALGTSYFQGGLARINERGGEIVNLPNGSQVIPADKSEKLLESRRGGVTVYVTIQGNVIGTNEFINQVGHVIAEEVQHALGNV